ncbi:MAG: hypothetical protein HQL22_10490 [Candidatus Omnitrophica bacterium]|nr:hypothetical protein [Candidatus Omnitrophota bacterium]
MKTIRLSAGVILVAGMLLTSSLARAFTAPPVSFEILDVTGIAALADDKLLDTYINTIAEIEAQRMLHMTIGFSAKEYDTYKDLVKYRLRILMEINRRKLEIPPAVN